MPIYSYKLAGIMDKDTACGADKSADKITWEATIAQLKVVSKDWSSSNTMSLGELWLGLLR